MIFGYCRVSKGEDQSLRLQHQALKKENVEKIFDEVASGGRWDRPMLHKMIDQLPGFLHEKKTRGQIAKI